MRRLALVFVVLLVLLGGGLAYLKTKVLVPDKLRAQLMSTLKGVYSGKIELKSVTYEAPNGFVVEGLILSDPRGIESWLDLERLEVRLGFPDLFAGRPHLDAVDVTGLRLKLVGVPGGGFTFQRFLKAARSVSPRPRFLAQAQTQAQTAGLPGHHPGITIDQLTLAKASIVFQDSRFLIDLDGMSARMSLGVDGLHVHEARGKLKEVHDIRMEGMLALAPPTRTQLKVHLERMPLPGILSLSPTYSLHLGMKGEALQGNADVTLGLMTGEVSWTLEVSARVEEAAWKSPQILGVDLEASSLDLESTLVFGSDQPRIRGRLDLTEGFLKPVGWARPLPVAEASAEISTERGALRLDRYSLNFETGTLSGGGFYRESGALLDYELSFKGNELKLPQLTQLGIPLLDAIADGDLSLDGRWTPGFLEFFDITLQRQEGRISTSLSLDLSSGLPQSQGGEGSFDLELASLLPAGLEKQVTGRVEGNLSVRDDKSPLPPVDAQLTGGEISYTPAPRGGLALTGEILSGSLTVTPSLVEILGLNLLIGGGELEMSGIVPLGGARMVGEVALKAAGIELDPFLPLFGMDGVFTRSRLGFEGSLAMDLAPEAEFPYRADFGVKLSPLHLASRPELEVLVPTTGITFPVAAGRLTAWPGTLQLSDLSAESEGMWMWGFVRTQDQQLGGQFLLKGGRIDPVAAAEPETVREVARTDQEIELRLDLTGDVLRPQIQVSVHSEP